MKLSRLFSDPSPLSMLGTIVCIGYFVWWGCASTAAPTLRPPTALPDGQRTQVGVGGNASFALLNTGAGANVWARHQLTDQIEVGGFGEYGALAWNSVSGGNTVLGGGLSGRFYLLTDARFRLGVEAYVAAAQTFQLGRTVPGAGSLFGYSDGGLTIAQAYVSLPMALQLGSGKMSLYTNPAAGLVDFLSWYGNYPSLPTGGIPLPTFRLPIGAEYRPFEHFSLVAEAGIGGLLLVGMGPYASLGATFSF